MRSTVMNLPAYSYDETPIICLEFENTTQSIIDENGPFEFIGEALLPTTEAIKSLKVGQYLRVQAMQNLIYKLRRTCYDIPDMVGGDIALRVIGTNTNTNMLIIDAYKLPVGSYYPVIRKEFYDLIDEMERDVIYYIGCHEIDTTFLVSYMAELWNKQNKMDYITAPKCTPGGNDFTWQFRKPSPNKRPHAVSDRINQQKYKEEARQAEKLDSLQANLLAAPKVKEWAAKPYHSLEVGQSCELKPSEYTKPTSLRQTVYAFSRRKGITMSVAIASDGVATITRSA